MFPFKRAIRSALLDCGCIHWKCWNRWRTWLIVVTALIYSIVILIVVPLLTFALYAIKAEAQFSVCLVAAIFVLLTIPIFLANLLQHLVNYTCPNLQAYIIRTIWIVPIYSVDSWFGLTFPSTGIYWTTVRECYESYALYNFLVYALNYLEAEHSLTDVLEKQPPTRHLFPFCCCYPWPTGRRFIRWIKVGVLQYALVRPILTVIALITEICGVYKEGQFRADRSFVYLSIINGISQGVSLYSLAYFYKAMRDLLKRINPVAKFATIKAIIFFTFWQAVLVAILVKLPFIKDSVDWKKIGFDDLQILATSLQDFIICVEMLGFALAFYKIFSHKPFINPAAAQVPCLNSCLKMLDLRDMYGDVREHFVDPLPLPLPLPGLVKRYQRKKKNDSSDEKVELVRLCDADKDPGSGAEEDCPLLIDEDIDTGAVSVFKGSPKGKDLGARERRNGAARSSVENSWEELKRTPSPAEIDMKNFQTNN